MRETKSQRRERRERKDRERQQVRRDAMKADGRPDTHAVNSAITEALAYLIASPGAADEYWARRRVTPLEVVDIARRILAARYDWSQSGQAVQAKLQPRDRYHPSLPTLKQGEAHNE